MNTPMRSLQAGAFCLFHTVLLAGPSAPSAMPPDPWRAAAQAACQGDGISLKPATEGAELRVVFQQLAGRVTGEGMWLESTEKAGRAERFRVRAAALGGATPAELAAHGGVSVEGGTARYTRPGLVEEFRVSLDGVRQDFVVETPPVDGGGLNVWLEISGAKAAPAAYGARLTLDGSGRALAYSRLHVTDARGRVLPARMEVAAADRLVIRVDDAGAAYPVRIDPTFSDEDWISLGGQAGVRGSVHAVALDNNGNLFVGGQFDAVGELEANNIARWNGTAWSTLGQGVNGEVLALAFAVEQSTLYVAGEFTEAGGAPAASVAAWNVDTQDWSALGTGISGGPVTALHFEFGQGLFAGGHFDEAGGTAGTARVALWNGSWSGFDDGPGGIGDELSSVAYFQGKVVAGGEFGILEWDGLAWVPVGGGVGGSFPYVYALAVGDFGNVLYAGGEFTTAGGIPAARIASWDGVEWRALGSGMNDWVGELRAAGSNLYAGGLFTTAGGTAAHKLAFWNGSAWSAVLGGEQINGSVDAIAVWGGDVYLGGAFTKATTVEADGLMRWNGSALSSIAGKGLNGSVHASLVHEGELYLGGSFTNAGGMIVNRIVKWNGSDWSALGAGVGGRVNALAAIGGSIYAGGLFTQAGGSSANRVARWDGTAWHALGAGVNGEVLALASMGTDLFAGGLFSSAGADTNIKRLAKWDGSSWSSVGGVAFEGTVRCLAVTGGDLYAGGSYSQNVAGVDLRRIAKWDGTAWSELGGGLNSDAYALAFSGSDLIVGGSFTSFGPATAPIAAARIARWDGSAWSTFGSGITGTGAIVRALAAHDSGIYAGGSFTTAGGSAIPHLARWTGGAWEGLASGVNAQVLTLTVTGDVLHAGGEFDLAGGKISHFAAQANLVPDTGTSVISFSQDVNETTQGANEVTITLQRTNATQAASVRLSTANGTNSSNPPFTGGRAGTDYAALSNTLVEFDAGQSSKNVTLTLIPRTGAVPNIRFRAILGSPSANADIGLGGAEIRILANDATAPTVNITYPTEGFAFSNVPPINIVGTAGDSLGIREVTLSFNGGPPVQASLGTSSNPLNTPFSGSFTPLEGANTIVATAYDLRGNSSSVTRNFTFTRSYTLTVTRNVPPAASANPDLAGTILIKASPTTGATRLLPAARTSPQTANVTPGTEVKLTARPKTGYFFSHWSGLPADFQLAGTGVTFIMPAEDAPNVTATFVTSPFTGLPDGSRINFYGQVRPDAGTPVNNSTVGFLNATLTTSTGALSGKLLMDGESRSFSARILGDGSVWYNVGGFVGTPISFGPKILYLEMVSGVLLIEVVNTAIGGSSKGAAKPAIYSAANPVPSALINEPAAIPQPNGYYTLALPPVVQAPLMDTSTYPQGAGYATLNIAGNGGLKLSGVLADGTKFTAASALVEGDVAPFFGQLPTPGDTSVKGGSIGGDLIFDASQPDSDILGADMLWLRPAAAVPLYPSGWPAGIAVDVIGALYDKTAGAQTLLGMGPVDPANGNGRLTFTEGTLPAPVVKTNFNVNGNQVVKVPPVPVDRSFNLTISNPLHGSFKGDFVPSGSTLKLKYSGVIVSKGALRAGYGYFLSSPISASPPQSGHALLEARTP